MAKLDGLEQDRVDKDRVDKLFEALDRFSGRELMAQGTVKVTKRGYDVFLSISTSEVISITKFSAGKWGVYSSKVGGGDAWLSRGLEWDEAIDSFRGRVVRKLNRLLSDKELRDVIELIQ